MRRRGGAGRLCLNSAAGGGGGWLGRGAEVSGGRAAGPSPVASVVLWG